MNTFTIYLINLPYNSSERYSETNGVVSENQYSFLDEGVITSDNPAIIKYNVDRNIDIKRIRRSNSNPDAYYQQSSLDNPPWWKGFWSITEKIVTSYVSGIVKLEVDGRLYIIAHGAGKAFINPNAICQDFGLKTAINMLNREKIKTADIFTPSEVGLRTKKQTGNNAKFEQYDIDVFNSLLKSASGKSYKKYAPLSLNVEGTDSLKLNHDSDITKLRKKIQILMKIYESEKYKSNGFEWIDNFRLIKIQV